MTNPFVIRPEWLHEDANASPEKATQADISIIVNEKYATKNWDLYSGKRNKPRHPRDG